jgi:hypothetical protein
MHSHVRVCDFDDCVASSWRDHNIRHDFGGQINHRDFDLFGAGPVQSESQIMFPALAPEIRSPVRTRKSAQSCHGCQVMVRSAPSFAPLDPTDRANRRKTKNFINPLQAGFFGRRVWRVARSSLFSRGVQDRGQTEEILSALIGAVRSSAERFPP